MDDSLRRAGVETQSAHPRAVREILAEVREQALSVFTGPFFDGDESVDTTPVVKIGVTESGTVHISARRDAPALQAEVMLYLRSEFETSAACRYHLHGACEIARTDGERHFQRDFALPIDADEDGNLSLDVAALRSELAHTIHAFRG